MMGFFKTEKKEKTKASNAHENSPGFNLIQNTLNRPCQHQHPTLPSTSTAPVQMQAVPTPSSAAPKLDVNAVMENIINSMTPPPQVVEVNQVMPNSAPSPAAAADSGSSSSLPTAGLAATNADPLTQDQHNSPESNVRSPSERLVPDDVAVKFDVVPLIDLSCPDKALLKRQINEAFRDFGCFQVINIGVSGETIEKAKKLSGSFHFWVRARSFSNGFNPLRYKIIEVVSESLGLEGDDSSWKVQGDGHGQHVAVNYYPPRTDQPGLTRGALHGHTDPNALTIHLLDQESAAGMQIFRRGRWMDVEPHPGALLITIGDKIEALSKGKYKSARYRMTVSPHKERISLPLGSFCCREGDATLKKGPSTGKSPAICS